MLGQTNFWDQICTDASFEAKSGKNGSKNEKTHFS
jgi:hypothetical protein